jgi:outer membrane protein insertion porin family
VALRYGLNQDKVTLDQATYFTDPDGPTGPAPAVCDPQRAGVYLCDAVGSRITSSIGYSFSYSNLNNSLRPSRGQRVTLSQDFAGLGGSVRYLRTKLNAAKYWDAGKGFIFSISGEGGYIHSFEDAARPGADPVRIIDRFFLGEPQFRGFDIRGVGPRVTRFAYDATGNLVTDRKSVLSDDAIGGKAYYLARLELEIPLGSSFKELGLRPSVFADAGALFSLTQPTLQNIGTQCADNTTGVKQRLQGILFRRYCPAAHLGRLRGQLELALRSVQDRYSSGPYQGPRG